MSFSYYHYLHYYYDSLLYRFHLVDAKMIVRQIQVEIEVQKKSNLTKIKISKTSILFSSLSVPFSFQLLFFHLTFAHYSSIHHQYQIVPLHPKFLKFLLFIISNLKLNSPVQTSKAAI